MKRVASFRHSVRRRLSNEEGFTMIELVIAVGVILTALVLMAYTATISFSDIALARQRQGANGLANQAMEQIRGLPFDTIRKGLANSDLSGDSNIVTCGAAKCYAPLNETIPTSNYVAGTTITPLIPHVKTIVSGQTSYTVKSYITYYQNNIAQNSSFRAIVVVSWASPARRGASARVENQSILYSGNGCLSTATHPFAAPCQPFFYGGGGVGDGQIQLTGTIAGMSLDRAALWPTTELSTMQVEQITAVQGTVQSSGVSLKLMGQDEQFGNVAQVHSAADNDPTQSDPDYSSVSLPSMISRTLTESTAQSTLSVISTAGDGGTTISTTDANTNPPRPCRSQIDNLACGSSTGWQGVNGVGSQKSTSIVLGLHAGDQDLGNTVMASLGPPSVQSLVYVNRDVTGEATECKQTSGDGCVHSGGSRALGQLSLGGLPALLPAGSLPVGWQGYLIRVTGFSDSVSAEAGKGTAGPTVTAAGTVSYWNGTGYSSLTISAGNPQTITVAPISIYLPLFQGGPLNVSLQATGLTTGGTSVSDPASCGANCTRTTASASSGSPLLGNITYNITWNGVTLCNTTTHVDLGKLTVSGEYQAAPGG